jgi:peptide/nickel transport system ATP-binding protein
LIITHDLSIVRQITERVYVMHHGRIVESGPTDETLDHPRDEYTVKLLDSVPRSDADWLSSDSAIHEAGQLAEPAG